MAAGSGQPEDLVEDFEAAGRLAQREVMVPGHGPDPDAAMGAVLPELRSSDAEERDGPPGR